MIPDSQLHQNIDAELLAKDEFSTLDPELFPTNRVVEKLKSREALLKEYVNVRKLAQVASGLGKNGLTTL